MASCGYLVSQLFYHLDNQLPGLDSLCLDTCSFKASLQRYLLNYRGEKRENEKSIRYHLKPSDQG